MAEVISVFSVIITVVGVLYNKKRLNDQATKQVLEKFETEFKEFLNNIFGWYNRIFSFTNGLIYDAKDGKLTAKKISEYQKLLDEIRGSDEHFSNCQRFINISVEKYLEMKPFEEEGFKTKLLRLQSSYIRFESTVIYHKDSMGYLLRNWKNLGPKTRKDLVGKIENEMLQIMSFKDAVKDAVD
jgi:hypothetical protein